MKKLVCLLLLVTATLVVACAGPGPAAAPAKAPMKLLMGTTSSGSSAYIYYVAIAKVINSKVPEVNVTVVESGASVDNVKRMETGEFHLGLVTQDAAYQAFHGMGPWQDKPQPWLRTLWIRLTVPVAYVVREDSGIKSLRELDGKELNPGMRGSATEKQTEAVMETLGIKPKWYRGDTADAVSAVKDRRIVGYVKALSAITMDASILDLMTYTPIRILGLSKEDAKKVQDKYPFHVFTDIPAGTYKAEWNKEPIHAPGLATGTSTKDTMPADLAYKIVKAIAEDLKPGGEGIIAAAIPDMKGLDVAKVTIEGTITPFHEGAYKYYKELGLTIPDKLVPPEVKK